MSTDRVLVAVDRLEGDQAVLEGADGTMYLVRADSLPLGATSGSVLSVRIVGGEVEEAGMSVDDAATAKRRAEAEEIIAELRRRDPGGDVIL